MQEFMHVPEALEALLVAEEAGVETELDAGWALQGRRLSALRVIASTT